MQIGGFTNAGHNTAGNKLGGVDEAPHSAASVIAPVGKAGFNGKITYDDVSNPGTAKQTGGDVSVFSSGFRNSFSITYHSRGFLLATDNGANVDFGDVSTGCNSQRALTQPSPDKLFKVLAGKYSGHPNRNRGRNDPQQCVFSESDISTASYEAPLATFESSTNGVIEMHSNLLGGQLKGDVLLTKYATNEDPGRIFRVRLDENGDVGENGIDVLWETSGLTIAMSPYSDLFMPNVFTSPEVVVLQPVYDVPPNTPILGSVMPFRGPESGGNVVQITGHGFGPNPVAFFGKDPCLQVSNLATDGTSFRCIAPPAPQPGVAVQVYVQVGGVGIAESTGGTDYLYMEI